MSTPSLIRDALAKVFGEHPLTSSSLVDEGLALDFTEVKNPIVALRPEVRQFATLFDVDGLAGLVVLDEGREYSAAEVAALSLAVEPTELPGFDFEQDLPLEGIIVGGAVEAEPLWHGVAALYEQGPVKGTLAASGASLQIGGAPTHASEKSWPHFTATGRPIPFAGSLRDGETIVDVFVDDDTTGSWELEDGPNAVITSDTHPHWVTMQPVASRLLLDEETYVLPGGELLPGLPDWIQGDETPDRDARFVGQLEPFGQVQVGGDGGVIYVFAVNDPRAPYKMVWQSS